MRTTGKRGSYNTDELSPILVAVAPGDKLPTKEEIVMFVVNRKECSPTKAEVHIYRLRTLPQIRSQITKLGTKPRYVIATKNCTTGAKRHATFVI
jgi:hypothetical protein